MTGQELFSGDRIRTLLIEVANQLDPAKSQSTVLLVGGSILAWHGLRLATEDVDTTLKIDAELRAAIKRVAHSHQLDVNWLNDHSSPWHPHTLHPEDCEVLINHPRLLVLGAPLTAVFLMKLNRSQPQDVVDMLTLWPIVADDFSTARAVSKAFYAAFPLEEFDEYLEIEIVDLARRAGLTLPLE